MRFNSPGPCGSRAGPHQAKFGLAECIDGCFARRASSGACASHSWPPSFWIGNPALEQHSFVHQVHKRPGMACNRKRNSSVGTRQRVSADHGLGCRTKADVRERRLGAATVRSVYRSAKKSCLQSRRASALGCFDSAAVAATLSTNGGWRKGGLRKREAERSASLLFEPVGFEARLERERPSVGKVLAEREGQHAGRVTHGAQFGLFRQRLTWLCQVKRSGRCHSNPSGSKPVSTVKTERLVKILAEREGQHAERVTHERSSACLGKG